MRIKNVFLTFFLAIIFAFIFTFGIFIFNKVFFKPDLDYIDKAVGAFMGAFFAFLFIRIGDTFAKIYERQKKHYNALVKLEYICNDYLNIASDNIFIIDDFNKIAENAFRKDQPIIYMNKLHLFPLDKEIVLSLGNIDLVNEVFTFNTDLNKMNSSIETVNRFYEEIKDAFIQRKVDDQTYKVNVQICIGKLIELKKFLVDLEEKTERILAISRILSKDKLLLTHFISKRYFTNKLEKKIPKEIEKLESEIAEVSTKSKKEIQEILDKK